jgi:RNA polymerase sigma-70 factor (ECF subfamily)
LNGAVAQTTGQQEHEETVGWAAFVDVYVAAMPAVYRYLHRGTGGDVALAEDLTQQTFMSAVRAMKGGRPEVVTPAWLQTVARSRLIDHYRRQAVESTKLAVVHRARADAGELPDDLTVGEAQAALRSLPPLQRAALVLRYLDDLSVAGVAEQLGRSVRATESLLVRARAAFKVAYEEHGDA